MQDFLWNGNMSNVVKLYEEAKLVAALPLVYNEQQITNEKYNIDLYMITCLSVLF